MRYLFPLIALSGGGETHLIPDVAAYLDFVRGRTVGERFALMRRIWDWRIYDWIDRDLTDAWIVRDDAGRIVAPGSLGDPKPKPRRRPHFDHRRGPVPFCGKRVHQKHDAPRKRHGGRGVAIRARLLHGGDPRLDVDE